MNTQREHAQQLLNHLAPEQVEAMVHLMEVMLDPLSRRLAAAPLDDEPFTTEDRQAVAEADEWSARNKPIGLEDVLADLGLTMTDWEYGEGAAPSRKLRVGWLSASSSPIRRELTSEIFRSRLRSRFVRWRAFSNLTKAMSGAYRALSRHFTVYARKTTVSFSTIAAITSRSLAFAIGRTFTADGLRSQEDGALRPKKRQPPFLPPIAAQKTGAPSNCRGDREEFRSV
jgi:hypothetical protein